MKLRPLAIVLFLFSPSTGELLCSSPPYFVCDQKTLAATIKKSASIAGFLHLRLNITRLTTPSLHPARASHTLAPFC